MITAVSYFLSFVYHEYLFNQYSLDTAQGYKHETLSEDPTNYSAIIDIPDQSVSYYITMKYRKNVGVFFFFLDFSSSMRPDESLNDYVVNFSPFGWGHRIP